MFYEKYSNIEYFHDIKKSKFLVDKKIIIEVIIINSHIWPPPVAIFLALRVWEGTIQDDKYLKWQQFGRNDNNSEGMTLIWKDYRND